jgi:hypothetical protein
LLNLGRSPQKGSTIRNIEPCLQYIQIIDIFRTEQAEKKGLRVVDAFVVSRLLLCKSVSVILQNNCRSDHPPTGPGIIVFSLQQ